MFNDAVKVGKYFAVNKFKKLTDTLNMLGVVTLLFLIDLKWGKLHMNNASVRVLFTG